MNFSYLSLFKVFGYVRINFIETGSKKKKLSFKENSFNKLPFYSYTHNLYNLINIRTRY